MHGEVIDLHDFGHRGEVALEIRGGLHGALVGKHHVIRRQRRAIMELHARTQLELPDLVVRRQHLPGGGKRRAKLARMVALGQRLIDVLVQRGGRAFVLAMRIERQRVARACPFQRARFGDAGQHGRRGEDREQAPDRRFHGTLPVLVKRPPQTALG